MAITTNLKMSNGTDLGNNLFAGNGKSNGNQTFNIIQANGVDLGKGWYNKSACYAVYGNVGFQNSSGVDVGTLLGKYGTLNCTCDTDIDTCDVDRDQCDSDTDGGCFVSGLLLTARGLVEVFDVVVDDLIWGTDEKWHKVIGVAKNVVGGRKIYTLDGGGVVTSDHIIYQGDCAYVPSMNAWGKSVGTLIEAENGIVGIYASPTPIEIDGAILHEASPNTKTYTPICEGASFIGYLNGNRVLIASQQK